MYDEKHFKPAELAKLWNVSGDTIRRLYRDVPGVLVIDRPEKRYKRGYCSMRVPESVAKRVTPFIGTRQSSFLWAVCIELPMALTQR